MIRSPRVLPPALGGGTEALVAADGASVRQARADGALGLDEAIVLGPTEPPFVELVELAAAIGAPDLLRGAAACRHCLADRLHAPDLCRRNRGQR